MIMSWDKTVFLLCIFGFLKEFRPSESFVTQYLLGPEKNFTKFQVNQEIYPVGTYSNLSLLVVVFLITDLVRYKPVIVVEGIAGVLVYALLIWGHDVPTMQVVEFFYGLFMATDIAYKTYMYAVCDVTQYQMVSACVQAAVLVGRFLSGVVSQISISFKLLSYHQLNFLTLGGVALSVPFTLFLPSVRGSMYFHRSHLRKRNSKTDKESCDGENGALSMSPMPQSLTETSETEGSPLKDTTVAGETVSGVREGIRAIVEEFLGACRNKNVVKWSLWWSLGTCGYLQVTNYVQLLWQVTKESSDQELLNGAIDAAYTCLGTIVLWFLGHQKTNLQPFGTVIIFISCVTQGIFLVICAITHVLWVQYCLYVMFKVLYHSVVVFASAEIAKSLPGDSNALIFGFNTFLALVFQTVLTLIVVHKGGLSLMIRDQFLVYGCYFIALGLGFCSSFCIPVVKLGYHSIFQSKSSASSMISPSLSLKQAC